MDLHQLASSFVQYFRKFNTNNIPEDFIKDYYVLSHGEFISVVEFTTWLGLNRKTMVNNIKKNYEKNVDYFEITMDDEKMYVKLHDPTALNFESNHAHIKITQKCFKNICIKSSTEKGRLMREYCMKLDDLFKKFHLDELKDMTEENELLKNNQKNNKKVIHNQEGIYVWKKIREKPNNYRIGRALNVYGRINDHDSSNIDKISPQLVVYVTHSDVVESMLKFCLEKCSYRGEFYTCDISVIEKSIMDICNFMKESNPDFVFDGTDGTTINKNKRKRTNICELFLYQNTHLYKHFSLQTTLCMCVCMCVYMCVYIKNICFCQKHCSEKPYLCTNQLICTKIGFCSFKHLFFCTVQ